MVSQNSMFKFCQEWRLGRSPTVLVQRLTVDDVPIQTQKHGECGGTGARKSQNSHSKVQCSL